MTDVIGSRLGDLRPLFRRTVPIFNFDQRQPELTGTGVFVHVEERRFVITAAHVFESGFRRAGFGYLGDEGLHVFGADNMRILTAKAQTGAGNPQRAVYKDGLDLAVVELPSEVVNALEEHYTPFDLRESDYNPGAHWGVLSGWPARKNTFDPKKRVGKFRTCYHVQCPFVSPEQVHQWGWNPDIYFGLAANKKKDFVDELTGQNLQLFNLEGMSGSGFWIKRSTSNWALGGIVVEDDQSKRALKVIKVRHVWTPLREFGVRP